MHDLSCFLIDKVLQTSVQNHHFSLSRQLQFSVYDVESSRKNVKVNRLPRYGISYFCSRTHVARIDNRYPR